METAEYLREWGIDPLPDRLEEVIGSERRPFRRVGLEHTVRIEHDQVACLERMRTDDRKSGVSLHAQTLSQKSRRDDRE